MPAPAGSRLAAKGQVLVVFALGVAGLLAAAGLAIDIGRFYSEHRFLQNAADAAALAAANAMIRGADSTQARTEAETSLSRNFLGDPNGVVASLPPASPVYESGHAGSAGYLVNGILISGGEVRVAVQNSISYTFGRVIGLGSQPIIARARVKLNGDYLPIAVRRYINNPGPNSGGAASYPCNPSSNDFVDFFATEYTACLGSETSTASRVNPSAGNAFDVLNPDSDPIHHGPILEILGQGAQPNNGADFRGFVALDIRNFATSSSQLYYNGVTTSTNSNTLKAMEANWIATGYPGPQFPSVIAPPDANDQVGIMSGNSTGIAVDAVNARFAPGDEVLVLVYDGNVMAIPDFTISPPSQIVLPASGATANAGTAKAARNQAFSGTVTLSTLADALDAQNPLTNGTMVGGTSAITYNPNAVTPSLGSGTNFALTNITTSGATPGIYTVWVQGQAGSPYLTTKIEPMAVMIGSVTSDFAFTADASSVNVATGSSATFDLSLANSPNKNTAFGGPVTLSVDTPLPTGIGAISFSSASVTPSKTGTHSTLTVNTGTLSSGIYKLYVRATGMNGDATPRKVTHILQLTLNVNGTSSGGGQEYVDISGFAVMRIATMDANTITGYAISRVYTDPNDPELVRGQVARLAPWS